MKKFILITFLLLIVGGIFFFYQILWAPNNFENDKVFIVSKGESFTKVMDRLAEAKVIRNKFLFKLAGKIHGTTTKIQIGKYRFRSGMSNVDILNDLVTGTSIEAIIVNIPEGWTSRKIASLLAREAGIDSSRFISLVHDEDFVEDFGFESHSLEGYLFPKTYRLYWQDDEKSIIEEFVKEFKKEFDSTLLARAGSLELTLQDVLTMASIIEGETRVDSERAIVSGVYYNRLKKGIRLQADPTIQFILPNGPRPLKYSDLKRQSPYNTYMNSGLPPGPVNNPGLASIRAALYPQKHKYLFFVANGEGGHTFTKNYKEHLKAVREYKRIREEKKAIEESM